MMRSCQIPNTWSALQVGLHQAALRCLPLFLLYLVTLMHTYSLAYLQVHCIRQSTSVHGHLFPDAAVSHQHAHVHSLKRGWRVCGFATYSCMSQSAGWCSSG